MSAKPLPLSNLLTLVIVAMVPEMTRTTACRLLGALVGALVAAIVVM